MIFLTGRVWSSWGELHRENICLTGDRRVKITYLFLEVGQVGKVSQVEQIQVVFM